MSKVIDLNEYRKKKNETTVRGVRATDDELFSILLGVMSESLSDLQYPAPDQLSMDDLEAESAAKRDFETYSDGDVCKCLFCGSIIEKSGNKDEDA